MDRIDRIIRALARWLALAGGLVLVGLVVVTCVSVVGRALDGIGHSAFAAEWLSPLVPLLKAAAPFTGDYELVEIGTAFAVMAFWPWCQLERGHATVDVLTQALPGAANRRLAALWEVVFALAVTLIAWRLYEGTIDKTRYGETLYLLTVPGTGELVAVWWAYAAVFVAACVAVLASWWSAILRLREAFLDRQEGRGA